MAKKIEETTLFKDKTYSSSSSSSSSSSEPSISTFGSFSGSSSSSSFTSGSNSSNFVVVKGSALKSFDGDSKLIFNPFLVDVYYSDSGTKGRETSSEYSLTFNTSNLRTSESTQDSREKDPELGKCNNFCSRAEGSEIRYLMQHYTVGNLKSTLETFTSKEVVSAHYVIDLDGTIYTMVDPKYKSYHAGVGQLKAKSVLNPYDMGKNAMNSWSIGIENVNDGRSPFPEKQIIANMHLMEYLVDNYKVSPKQVIGHSEWAPSRKIDPGPYFPWQKLSLAAEKYDGIKYNFGSYCHTPLKKDAEIVASKGKGSKEEIEHIQKNLSSFGYIVPEDGEQGFGLFEESTARATLAFGLHYMQQFIVDSPEKMKVWDVIWGGGSGIGLQEWTENHEVVMNGLLDQEVGAS